VNATRADVASVRADHELTNNLRAELDKILSSKAE
jgi:hypothetical protein